MPTFPTHASYDELPYDGGIAPNTHPQTAAVIGLLFGMEPAPVEECRVLEIGCGGGRNLVPMAYSLPGSTFVGMDLGRTHIEQAQAAAARLDLRNITFIQADIRNFTPPGLFDYIICHGVFSWVPPDARAAILDVCRTSLAPRGIAHISYNSFPGWHMRGVVREMMRFHARSFAGTTERVEQARAFVSFLANSTSAFEGATDEMTAYHLILRSQFAVVAERPDFYVAHEHLAEVNDPFYFLDFVDQLSEHRLRYLGDANFASMLSENLPEDVSESLDQISPTREILEQYRDFVVNRMFRQSLVVRDDTPLNLEIDAGSLSRLTIRSASRPEADGRWMLARAGGTTRELQTPLAVDILRLLYEALPGSLTLTELANRCGESEWPPEIGEEGREAYLASVVLSLFATDALDLRAWDPAFSSEISDCPSVFAPARHVDNTTGSPAPHHRVYGFDPLVSWLIPLINGALPKSRLADVLEARFNDGSLEFESPPEGVSDFRESAELLVDVALEQLKNSAMLEVPKPAGEVPRS